MIHGRVVGAEGADLNGNGLSEGDVFVEGAGSGRKGERVADAVINGSDLSPISLPELCGAMAKGDQGHDQFQVVEGRLLRRCSIDKAGDTTAKATLQCAQVLSAFLRPGR